MRILSWFRRKAPLPPPDWVCDECGRLIMVGRPPTVNIRSTIVALRHIEAFHADEAKA